MSERAHRKHITPRLLGAQEHNENQARAYRNPLVSSLYSPWSSRTSWGRPYERITMRKVAAQSHLPMTKKDERERDREKKELWRQRDREKTRRVRRESQRVCVRE